MEAWIKVRMFFFHDTATTEIYTRTCTLSLHDVFRSDKRKLEHMTSRQAAYDAGKRRMVPIFLTTATSAVGVIPMIMAGSSFWQPVGIAIFAGGVGSLILVVTMLPVMYWKLYKKG